jgi:predicted phage terminase large subunit-like protein
MAKINGIDQDKLKKVRTKKALAQREELKRLKEKAEGSVKKEHEHKENVLDIYNSLSEHDKLIFHNELEKKKVRDNYINYLKYVYPHYVVTKFHALLGNICQSVVEKIENGQKVKVCISCPPQHGKSCTVTETLPSWFIGRNPDLRCIITAYNADVAEKFGNKNRQLVKQYGQDLFGITISESQDNKTLWDIDKHQGGMLSTGILGGLTSNGGALVIVDDPFKNGEDANNQDLRDKVYDTFADSVSTRARGKGNAIIVIHTRWHEDDLIGRLKKSGDWIVINIPCIWEKGVDKLLGRRIGETLCPELGFDGEWAESMKKLLGIRKWNALYQGDPLVDGGNIIKRSDIRYYDRNSEPTSYEEIVLSCDLTFGGMKTSNDPYCMSMWGRVCGNHYLLKVWDKRANFIDTIKAIRIICHENPLLHKKIIERKANGQATIDMLSSEIGGFVPYDPKNTSKEDRLRSISPYFEGGNIYFPCEEIMPNVEEYVQQLLKFPSGEHDDFVDTTSQYLLNYEYRYGGKIDTDNRFGLLAKAIRGNRYD